MKKKILFTLFILILYEAGSMITLPGINTAIVEAQMQTSTFLQLANLVGGGSIDKMSLFALGVSPFITASIIVQMLSSDVIPYLSRLRDQGIKGHNKLDRITRIAALFVAAFQGYGVIMTLSKGELPILADSSWQSISFILLLMVTGTMITLWFGDLLTIYGLGNGASMIIAAGILMRIPGQISQAYSILTAKGDMTLFGLYMLFLVITIMAVVVLQKSELHIPIWDPSSRIKAVNDKDTNFLPLKINTPGVIPVIFASAFMTAPLQLTQIVNNTSLYDTLMPYLGLNSWVSIGIYALLIVLFSFFYAKIQVDPKKVAESLRKRNNFIPNIQPGDETEKYISKSLFHVMIYGAAGLTIIAIAPYILSLISELPAGIALGGTGLIIIVGVFLEIGVQMKGLNNKERYLKFRM